MFFPKIEINFPVWNEYLELKIKLILSLKGLGKIESLSKHMKQFKKDKHSSVGLLRAVNRRKKLLDYLKKNNMDTYKVVLTKLNLRK